MDELNVTALLAIFFAVDSIRCLCASPAINFIWEQSNEKTLHGNNPGLLWGFSVSVIKCRFESAFTFVASNLMLTKLFAHIEGEERLKLATSFSLLDSASPSPGFIIEILVEITIPSSSTWYLSVSNALMEKSPTLNT